MSGQDSSASMVYSVISRDGGTTNGRVGGMMKLVIAVVQNEDADAVVDALLEDEFRATRLASTGGFLRRGNTTLMIGADEDQVDRVLDLIRQNTRTGMAPAEDEPAMAPPAAATVFVLDLEEYQRL
jgi:uncharacterized protein YaaQ